jgi:hypothetical protein
MGFLGGDGRPCGPRPCARGPLERGGLRPAPPPWRERWATGRGPPTPLSLAYPWGPWNGPTRRERPTACALSPTSLALGYADGTWGPSPAPLPFARARGAFPPPGALRGSPTSTPRYEGGALRGVWPGGGWRGRGGVRAPAGGFPADGPHTGHPSPVLPTPLQGGYAGGAGAGLRPGPYPPFPPSPLSFRGSLLPPGLLWPSAWGTGRGALFGKPGPEPGEGASLPGVAGGPPYALKLEGRYDGGLFVWPWQGSYALPPPRARNPSPWPLGRVRGGAGGGGGVGGPGGSR